MFRRDVVVVGGGLAGVLAAEVLHRDGWAVRVIDAGGRRASDAPCALVHPFVGGSFAPRAHVEAAWMDAITWFGAREDFVRSDIVRRHIPETSAGERLLRSWPKVEPLARRLFAHVVPPTRARFVEYGPVLAVDLGALLEAERGVQLRAGIDWYTGRVRQVTPCAQGCSLELEGGAIWSTSRVVIAAGAAAKGLLRPFADVSSLARAEGALAWSQGLLPGPFRIHGGHASCAPSRMAWGASYRMLEGDARDPDQAMLDIDARLRSVGAALPSLDQARRWTATRLVDTGTRTPWVLEHAPGIWSMCAFGSQGCLWGPWSARRLVEGGRPRGRFSPSETV
ncbi:MAG: FAD-dependent oxidoreductase [Nannocystaceae bacterium]|nr:FAD-dependent oxidoreductase [Nannocystaceae bacterium]